MSMHRALFAVVLSFGACVSPFGALAQDAAPAADSAAALGAESLFAPPAPAQSALVPIKGVVSGSPESVSFSGQAKVSNRLAPDPDFFKPRFVVTIDLTAVAGVGSMTGAKYVISGPEFVQRHVAASHAVQITFPFKSSTSPTAVTARTGVASFVLDFDVNTGAVTGASGNVSSPNFPR
jgi:hypothetical protein